MTIQVREVHVDLLKGLDTLQQLDLIYAKAKYSIEIKGNKPFLKEFGPLKIVEARHPILLLRHSREQITPLSIELGNGYNTLLITGPNAGGKSVAMKTVGVLVLMLQCGIHIPASPDSEFPIFKKLYVDIGDDQSIENDLSTFSSHITMLKGILNSADNDSLVLIDEIGAGTDPVEGGALAAVILAQLTKAGVFTIATTHQVTLKAFVHETAGMENGAMEFDQATLMPTFHFRFGVPGSSYALEIARRLGVPSTLIAEAEKMAGEQKSRLEKLIVDLESRSQSLSKQILAVDAERLKFNELIKDYETKLKGLKEEIKLTKSKAIEEAKEIINKANSIIEKSVKEIRQRQASSSSWTLWLPLHGREHYCRDAHGAWVRLPAPCREEIRISDQRGDSHLRGQRHCGCRPDCRRQRRRDGCVSGSCVYPKLGRAFPFSTHRLRVPHDASAIWSLVGARHSRYQFCRRRDRQVRRNGAYRRNHYQTGSRSVDRSSVSCNGRHSEEQSAHPVAMVYPAFLSCCADEHVVASIQLDLRCS